MTRIVKRGLFAGVGAALLLYGVRSYWSGAGEGDCCDRESVVFAQEKKPIGGDLIPLRQVIDPYAVFNGIAVDPESNLVVMTDVNRKSLLAYGRTAELSKPDRMTRPQHQIFGPETNIGFVAGVVLDPQRHEIFAGNNDIDDNMVVMPYD